MDLVNTKSAVGGMGFPRLSLGPHPVALAGEADYGIEAVLGKIAIVASLSCLPWA